MKPLRIFRATGDCGCGSSQTLLTNTTGACADPAAGAKALICDPKYFNLGVVTKMRLLGVPLGGQCQLFLKSGNVDPRGFVFMDSDGQVFIEDAPKLTLPFLNPAEDDVFPVGPDFSYLMVGNGAFPVPWKFYAAPTAGEFNLQAFNGSWRLRDASSSAASTAVCSSGTLASKVHLFGCVETGELNDDDEPIYVLRKLNPTGESGRIVVSFVPEDASPGFRTLPLDEPLVHPSIHTEELRVLNLVMVDEDGDPIVGGFPIDDRLTDADAVAVSYSPTSKKFYREAEKTYYEKLENAGVGPVAIPGTYSAMPGGHGASASIPMKHSKAMIFGMVNFGADEELDIALYRDGGFLASWKYGTPETVVFWHIDTGIPVGNHTYTIYWKKGAGPGTGTCTIRTSSIVVISLPD